MSKLVESIVRTNKLFCSDCKTKINIGDTVLFKLSNNSKFIAVYDSNCRNKHEIKIRTKTKNIMNMNMWEYKSWLGGISSEEGADEHCSL